MKHIKLTQFDAAILLAILKRVDQLDAFKYEPSGSFIDLKNMTRNEITNLEYLLSQVKTKKAV